MPACVLSACCAHALDMLAFSWHFGGILAAFWRHFDSYSSRYQSDSDDTNCNKRFIRFSNLNNISNVESDSVNENYVPRNIIRRKRKFKKIAVGSDSAPSTSQITSFINCTTKKKRFLKNDYENRCDTMWYGKRERSCRERSTDSEMRSTKSIRNIKVKSKNKVKSEDAMDCSVISSSSISSSDSENEIATNDEDREGDDEQSDWVGDSSWYDDCENTSEEKINSCTEFQRFAHGSNEYSNEEEKRNSRERMQSLRDGCNGLTNREILAGRRHVDNTPGYSIITSANEKVSRFLQDPSQSKLKLHPIRQCERDRLRRLANLYKP